MRVVIEMSYKGWRNANIIVWTALCIVIATTVYSSYFLPHGPSYDTGDVVCENDDRGPCGEQYKEDVRNLDIPWWAKALRNNGDILPVFGLIFLGIYVNSKKNKTKNREESKKHHGNQIEDSHRTTSE